MSAEALPLFDPYSGVSAMSASVPDWMGAEDARRINAYQVYEQIYWSVPDTFKLVQRGTDAQPIYVPNARVIVDTTNRYVGNGFSFIMDPDVSTPDDQGAFKSALLALFQRERFYSKFNMNKRMGLIRGDWCFHVTANPAKAAGARIRLDTLDPGAYFPVSHPDDPDHIIAVHIVEQIIDGDDTFIKRQTYQRGADPVNNDGSDTTIYNSISLYANEEGWESLEARPEQVLKPIEALPPQITAIPVYHFKNIESPGDAFGSSELRGLERIMAAVNQGISDEELALALEGLGMYATDAGPPTDDDGNPTNWRLGPGRVVEIKAGSTFNRVDGIGSVTPYMDHLGFLTNALKEASATPDVAIGKVDVAVAESGVSLALQMGPLLSKSEEREVGIGETSGQMLFDLRSFFAAYEGLNSSAYAVPVFGAKLPIDRSARIKEILEITAAGVSSTEWAREELGKYDYVFPENEGDKINEESKARTSATDAWLSRAAGELIAGEENGATAGQPA